MPPRSPPQPHSPSGDDPGSRTSERQPEAAPTAADAKSATGATPRRKPTPPRKATGTLRQGHFAGKRVRPGETVDVEIKVSETLLHQPMRVPVTVARGAENGPILFVTSALHGDEINGIAIVRRLLDGLERTLERGTVVAVPVANRFGFEARDRYLPDRRDLNRAFPGDPGGHMAARIADALFRNVVLACDVGVDLHTAAEGNTNLCHIRGDAGNPAVRPLMKAFGIPVMVDGEGPRGSLRRAATDAGVPTILFEAGEPGRFQRHVVEVGLQGVVRLMHGLGMASGGPPRPRLQLLVRTSQWVRSGHGGILDLLVEPGDLVRKGQALGSITEPLGKHVDHIGAPTSGVVIGTCTSPLVYPGMAVVHIGHLDKTFAKAEAHVRRGGDLGHLTPAPFAHPPRLGSIAGLPAAKVRRSAPGAKRRSAA